MQNWSALLSFELIYKIVGLTMFFPFLRNLISFLSVLSGKLSQSGEYRSNIVNPHGSFIIGMYTFALGRYLYLEVVNMAGIAGYCRGCAYFNGVDGRWLFGLYYDTFTGAWNLLAGAFISVFLCALAIVLYHW